LTVLCFLSASILYALHPTHATPKFKATVAGLAFDFKRVSTALLISNGQTFAQFLETISEEGGFGDTPKAWNKNNKFSGTPSSVASKQTGKKMPSADSSDNWPNEDRKIDQRSVIDALLESGENTDSCFKLNFFSFTHIVSHSPSLSISLFINHTTSLNSCFPHTRIHHTIHITSPENTCDEVECVEEPMPDTPKSWLPREQQQAAKPSSTKVTPLSTGKKSYAVSNWKNAQRPKEQEGMNRSEPKQAKHQEKQQQQQQKGHSSDSSTNNGSPITKRSYSLESWRKKK